MDTVYFGPFALKTSRRSGIIPKEARYATPKDAGLRRRHFIERKRAELLVRVSELLLVPLRSA